MKTKSIFIALITLFISVASFGQYAGSGSGSGSGNGSSGVTGAGRSGHTANRSSVRSSTHRSAKGKRHSSHRSAAPGTALNRTSSINSPKTGLSNTGGNESTMPDNNDPGKETTSDKGKDGPTNGVVKKGVAHKSGHK